MTTIETLTPEVKQLIENNIACEDFRCIPCEFAKLDNGKYGFIIDWNRVTKHDIDIANKNLSIIQKRVETRDKRTDILVGDYLKRKNGKISRITYILGNSLQDGGGRGSFYLSQSGNASYSGGLDDPIAIEKIKPTEEIRPAEFWFFSQDWSGGNRGVYFQIDVKVWEEK